MGTVRVKRRREERLAPNQLIALCRPLAVGRAHKKMRIQIRNVFRAILKAERFLRGQFLDLLFPEKVPEKKEKSESYSLKKSYE